ncbi:sulfurtransferase TusA family protein [Prochlorococcus marinus]|uniref:sulfurtransferase TusA family protein n=1 Tax=Prochlorococcus marinus TaxID=1219 RepID=UPI0022B38C2C|nr:sulfurtransferase TusA family protein [Prochlorococcus marinus]
MVEKNIFIDHYLDLCGLSCPVNFVKCCLALENLSSKDILKVDIDIGEAETNVIDGLKEKGYKVKILTKDSKKVTLIISSE